MMAGARDVEDRGADGVDSSRGAASRPRRRGGPLVVPVLPRNEEGVAPIARAKGRLEAAHAAGDRTEEAKASRELAELLASRGTELDVAIELAERSLALDEDPVLRLRLGEWLEGTGEHARAAAVFAGLARASAPTDAAQFLVRAGVLHARAGDAVSAREALVEATGLDEQDALAFELLGVVGLSTESELDVALGASRAASRGAAAYFAAARRRAAAGDSQGELEDLLRAFELDPANARIEDALVAALSSRGRPAAADEIRRAHARACAEPETTRVVHARRAAEAVARGDLARALSAALDGKLDVDPAAEHAATFDGWLLRAGLLDVLAARLGMRAATLAPSEAAATWAELGRLLDGALASPARAVEAYAKSVAADATDVDAFRALEVLSSRAGMRVWLVEALVRGTLGASASGASDDAAKRLAAAHALAKVATDDGDDVLAGFARAEIARLDPADERAREFAARSEEIVRRHRAEAERALRELEETSAREDRTARLEEVARRLASLPDASRELAGVLEELAAKDPTDDARFFAALRVAERVADFARMARICRTRLSADGEAWRARVELASALVRLGDGANAAKEADALASASSPWAIATAWTTGATAGDRRLRARAIAAAASSCSAPIAAALSVVAADEFAALGDAVAARSAAEAAHRADPDDARVLATLASACSPEAEAKLVVSLLERAVSASLPTSSSCERLARAYERLDDPAKAFTWTRRLVALRPGDVEVLHRLVERGARGGDTPALLEVLAWLVPQPQPAPRLAPVVAAALEALSARAPAEAISMARRALDALGPRDARLVTAIESVATASNDLTLSVKLEERRLASAVAPEERGARCSSLARRYEALGDVACELDAIARAARAGADLEPVSDRLRALARTETSKDGEISRLEACVALARTEGRSDLVTSYARELGAALWSWAGDRAKALDVWLAAAVANGSSGPRVLRVDLTTFGGAREAEVQLADLADREADPERAGLFAVEAARAAMESGAFPRALSHARAAIAKCSGHAEALEVAESASVRAGRPREMEPLYDHVAQGARGRFGRRAAHHRAARFFEAQGLPMFALKHAAQAFIAVPSEGTTLALLERTAEKANRRAVAARTVEHVADLARGPDLRAAWLERAVELAAKDADGLRQRFELLLKATVLRPSPGLVDRLAAAARALLAAVPDDVETMALRLEHAGDELSKKLEGPDGARIGIAFAELALDPFSHGRWAWQSLHRAFDADADVDEYARLLPRADRLAADPAAREETSRWLAAAERPYANVGSALFRLAAEVARRLDDAAMAARALVSAVEKEPDDDQLVADADEAVASVGSEELAARLAKKVGPRRRTSLPAAAPKPASVAPKPASVAPKPASVAPKPASVAPKPVSVVPIVAASVEPAPVTPVAEPSPVTPVATLAPATLEELRQTAASQPTFERWLRVERAADAADDEAARIEALQNLVLLAPAEEKLDVLKRLARAEGARGELAAAELHWREVVERRPFDPDADVALEALFVARGAFTELGEHLGRRVERLGDDDETSATRRALRLRRAAIYEQRLLKLEEAAAELERLLIEFPGNESALRWLADLNERLGWHRDTLRVLDELSRRPMDPQEREALQIRRTKAMLALGDGDGARTTVAQMARHPFDPVAVLELRVEVGRVLDDPEDLGAALVELGRISSKDAAARSEMFVEAAQAAARLGDDRLARERAAEGARLAPHAASVQLFACGLEYRARRAGTVDEARATIDVLSRFQREGTIAAEDVPLAAFLLAEAEDVVTPGSGERTLRECLVRTGPHPLLALGLAERAAAAGRPREALVGYAEALSGNLLGLRSEGAIALAAVDLADPVHDADLIERLLDRAEADPAAADAAQARRSARAAESVKPGKPPIVTPVRSVAVAPPKVLVATGPSVPESAIVVPTVVAPPPDRSTPRAMEAGPPEDLGAETPIAFTPAGELREAYASLYRGDSVTAEQLLFDALRGGSLEAADALDALLSKDRTRGPELLAVRRRAVEIQPGNLKRLARLREAARLDQNAQLFRAIDHVLAPFEPGREPVPPPPLTAQSAQPGMLMLLSRHSLEPTGEALGIVWEHAQGLFVRSLSATGTTGLERVVPGPTSPLSRLYEVTLRLLDTPKFALFHRRSSEPEGISVLLLTPPSAVLTSDAREDTPLVRWRMGEALSGALPENALLFGLAEAEARSLLAVLSVAFGSAQLSLDRAQAQLAESLWQTLPARSQRRLRELFAAETPYELAMERAKQSGRRIGMFLTGDFEFAARRVLDEFPSVDAGEWDADGGLEHLCAELPALSDLFRLAVTPEYADARWRKPAPTSPLTSGRTSLV